jgi:hypothetical protein
MVDERRLKAQTPESNRSVECSAISSRSGISVVDLDQSCRRDVVITPASGIASAIRVSANVRCDCKTEQTARTYTEG